MQEKEFEELCQDIDGINAPTFSYSNSNDVIYWKLTKDSKYEEYKKGLEETIYVNGYSDLYSPKYINETLEKNKFKLFVENEKYASDSDLNYSNIFENIEEDETFLYLSRDSKHFMVIRAIKDGDTMKLYVVNSSPKTTYLLGNNDELIKTISEKTEVKNIIVKEIKPPIYQLGNFACFAYALKNAKELKNLSKTELDSIVEENEKKKEILNENIFSMADYKSFKYVYSIHKKISSMSGGSTDLHFKIFDKIGKLGEDTVTLKKNAVTLNEDAIVLSEKAIALIKDVIASSKDDITSSKDDIILSEDDITEDDIILYTIEGLKYTEKGSPGSIYKKILIDKKRLAGLNEIRLKRQEEYSIPGVELQSSIPQQSSTVQKTSKGGLSFS